MLYVCVHMYTYTFTHIIPIHLLYVIYTYKNIYVYIHVCVYIHMCVCVYMYL